MINSKKILSLGILYIFVLKLNLAGATNYCDPALCTTNDVVRPHIGCKHSGQFASSCIEPAVIPVTPHLRKILLHTHNDLRNKVANGSLQGFQSARRMTTLTWDTELEFLAGLNIRSCEMAHDECHNTIAYKYSGQNLAIQYQTDPLLPPEYETLIVYLINQWFDEHTLANQRDVDRCVRNNHANDIGHFTEMVQEKSSKVGCSLVRFVKFMMDDKWDTLLMACNYSFGNVVDKPIYVKGPMASSCETGTNPEFNGLCSVSENVPPVPEDDVPSNILPLPRFPTSRFMQPVTSSVTVRPVPSTITRQPVGPSNVNSRPGSSAHGVHSVSSNTNRQPTTLSPIQNRSVPRPQQAPPLPSGPPPQIIASTRGLGPIPSSHGMRAVPLTLGTSPSHIRATPRSQQPPPLPAAPPPPIVSSIHGLRPVPSVIARQHAGSTQIHKSVASTTSFQPDNQSPTYLRPVIPPHSSQPIPLGQSLQPIPSDVVCFRPISRPRCDQQVSDTDEIPRSGQLVQPIRPFSLARFFELLRQAERIIRAIEPGNPFLTDYLDRASPSNVACVRRRMAEIETNPWPFMNFTRL